MKIIYGVDSATPINQKLKNGYTLYDWIIRQRGFPLFCFRTLCGDNPITLKEINFLKEKKCKVGFVLRDLTEEKVSTRNAKSDAIRVIEAAKSLDIPQYKNIAIFAEIGSDWSINHNWMVSYAKMLYANGYIPGFIANTDSSVNYNFDRQCSHYVYATAGVNQYNAVYCATEPKQNKSPVEWKPFCPSVLEQKDISFWKCSKMLFDNTEIGNVYALNEKCLANFL